MKKNKERGNGTEKLGKKKKDRNGSGVKPDSWKFSCEEKECNYTATSSSHVKTHKAMVHDIDAVWFSCGVNGCKYKAKVKSSVKNHKASVHKKFR